MAIAFILTFYQLQGFKDKFVRVGGTILIWLSHFIDQPNQQETAKIW